MGIKIENQKIWVETITLYDKHWISLDDLISLLEVHRSEWDSPGARAVASFLIRNFQSMNL